MKDIFAKFNEAVEKLKKTASPEKFTEVSEKYSKLPTIETKLNCVEEAIAQVLKENDPHGLTNILGISNIDEVMCDPSVAVLFGREPKQAAQPTSEAAPIKIKKHNGAAENFTEGSPFNRTEGRSAAFVEGANPESIFAKADAVIIDTLTNPLTKEPISEAQKAALRGGKPAAYTTFTEKQKNDYNVARLIGLNEADALIVAKL